MADLSVKLADRTLRNPVMNASGTLGYGNEIEPLWTVDTMGAYVSKGLSFMPHDGNPPPRLWEESHSLINSVGLQNIGLRKFIDDVLPLFEMRKTPVIVNFFGFTEEDYEKCAEAVPCDGRIIALEINLSCPNIKHGGLCLGKEKAGVFDIVRRVKAVTPLPLFAKLTPEVTDIVSVANAAFEGGADGITVYNTFPAQAVDTRRQALALRGGLSGPFLKPMALKAVTDITRAIPLPVIGVGGIMNANDALAFFMAGASAIQVGTATFVDPYAIPKIIKGIEEYLDLRNIPNLGRIIGTARA
jgi:dihydroorotate dehydrogenase (NAD+) catalytic subunit